MADRTWMQVLSDALWFNPVGAHGTIALGTAGTAIAAAAGANKVLIQALNQNIRYTLDGVAAGATFGFQLKAADASVVIPLGPSTAVKLASETGTASLQYQWGNSG